MILPLRTYIYIYVFIFGKNCHISILLEFTYIYLYIFGIFEMFFFAHQPKLNIQSCHKSRESGSMCYFWRV